MRALYAMLLFEVVEARRFVIPGANVRPSQIIARMLTFLWGTIVAFCTLIFAVGALFMIFGAGKEDMFQKGKTMMIGAIVGFAVVIGAPAMLRTFFWVFRQVPP